MKQRIFLFASPWLLLISACFNRPDAERAHPRFSTDDIAENNRGVGLMGQFQYQQAHDLFQTLSQRYPDWVPVKINVAIATLNLQTEGSEQRALDLLAETLLQEPDNPRALYCSALLHLYKGETSSAMPLFRRVAEADPEDAYAAYYLGQCLARQSQYEQALVWYTRAGERDPYLRSVFYGMFQSYQRLKQKEKALKALATFQKLKDHVQATQVEIKYTRMGPKAEAATVDLPVATPITPPKGPLFGEPYALELPLGKSWQASQTMQSMTAGDLNGDGHVDIIAAGVLAGAAPNGIFFGKPEGGFQLQTDHPLAVVDRVRAVLWGDMDNDGLVDIYLCRQGSNQLWHQHARDQWRDVSAASGTALDERNTVDGMWLDADHDGDLDLFLVNGDGPDELLNNNLDGSFRPLASERNIHGGKRASRSLLAADLDLDRDLDLIVIHEEPPHGVYLNDRLWAYHPAEGFENFINQPIKSLISGDADSDGRVELYTQDQQGRLQVWQAGENGSWQSRDLTKQAAHGTTLAYADIRGNGEPALLFLDEKGWRAQTLGPSPMPHPLASSSAETQILQGLTLTLDHHGPSLLERRHDGSLWVRPPGTGRHGFVTLRFSGADNNAESMRSNALGIGTRFALRRGSHWSAAAYFRNHGGPGQGLQPVAMGLGDAERADFLAIHWSDGVFQTELDLPGRQSHLILETQRQLSSCPVLFAWDGNSYTFVSDLLGVGGIGFAITPNQYSTPRPWEHFQLPPGLLKPKQDFFSLKIAEPMEEACYLDAVSLVYYDLPPGWQMVLDERMGISEPAPTGEPRFYRRELLPEQAKNERGQVVTQTVLSRDLKAAPLPASDRRFLGLLTTPQQLSLVFPEPLDRGSPILMIDGWVEYPYSQTGFAAWQAGRSYDPPDLEARAPGGAWLTVTRDFGYPAGMPRRMSLPLSDLPPGTTELRLSTNQEIYWDRVAVVFAEPCPRAQKQRLHPAAASLQAEGFARRTTGDQRLPHYEDKHRVPLWDTRHQDGFYTAFGRVDPLLAAADDALVIFGPGEALTLSFPLPTQTVEAGWSRSFVLETVGWCKDMDLYTKNGETLAPLPESGKPKAAREALHQQFNTRYQSGY